MKIFYKKIVFEKYLKIFRIVNSYKNWDNKERILHNNTSKIIIENIDWKIDEWNKGYKEQI